MPAMLTGHLLAVAAAYCARTGLSRSRVSTLVFNHGQRLDLIDGGADLATRSYERAMLWFSANWPQDLEWPADVVRPEPEVAQ
jgi:hypothetical protein